MKRKDLQLGDLFTLDDVTYFVTYIGKYGLTAYCLSTCINIPMSFKTDTYSNANPILIDRGNFSSLTAVQNAYPEFFI